jgi:hypothetical protein
MALDPEQTAKVQAWLQQYSIKACPVCKSKKWTVADPVGLPFILGSNIGKALPSLPFICGRCGLTLLINLNNIGLP